MRLPIFDGCVVFLPYSYLFNSIAYIYSYIVYNLLGLSVLSFVWLSPVVEIDMIMSTTLLLLHRRRRPMAISRENHQDFGLNHHVIRLNHQDVGLSHQTRLAFQQSVDFNQWPFESNQMTATKIHQTGEIFQKNVDLNQHYPLLPQ